MADETKIQPTAPSPPPGSTRSPAAGGGGSIPPQPPRTGGGGGGGGGNPGDPRQTGSPDRPSGTGFRAKLIAGIALLLILLWVLLGSGWLSNDSADEGDVTPVTSGTGAGETTPAPGAQNQDEAAQEDDPARTPTTAPGAAGGEDATVQGDGREVPQDPDDESGDDTSNTAPSGGVSPGAGSSGGVAPGGEETR